jgi:hypothetical protein
MASSGQYSLIHRGRTASSATLTPCIGMVRGRCSARNHTGSSGSSTTVLGVLWRGNDGDRLLKKKIYGDRCDLLLPSFSQTTAQCNVAATTTIANGRCAAWWCLPARRARERSHLAWHAPESSRFVRALRDEGVSVTNESIDSWGICYIYVPHTSLYHIRWEVGCLPSLATFNLVLPNYFIYS